MNCEFELQIVIFGLNVQRYDFFLRYARMGERGREKKHNASLFFFPFSSLKGICGVFMGCSWDIYGVFVGYMYVSGMCRECIGYVSGIYRKIRGGKNEEK